jgi:hypothetical protein
MFGYLWISMDIYGYLFGQMLVEGALDGGRREAPLQVVDSEAQLFLLPPLPLGVLVAQPSEGGCNVRVLIDESQVLVAQTDKEAQISVGVLNWPVQHHSHLAQIYRDACC